MNVFEIAKEQARQNGNRYQMVLESTGTGDYCLVDTTETEQGEVIGINLHHNQAMMICENLNKRDKLNQTT